MFRKITTTSLSLVLLGIPLLSSAVALAQKEIDRPPAKRLPRFAAPAHGRPGYVRFQDYLEMQDPRRASRLLLEEAAVAQLDLDGVGHDLRDMPLTDVPAPKKVVENRERVYGGGSADNGSSSDTTWCVVKLSRSWSIREMAAVLENGILIYWRRGASFLAWLPGDKKAFLAGQPFVQWFQPYTAEMKFYPEYRFESGRTRVGVASMRGDQPRFRAELKSLGADIEDGSQYGYTVWIDSTRIGDVAKLSWVYNVTPTSTWGL